MIFMDGDRVRFIGLDYPDGNKLFYYGLCGTVRRSMNDADYTRVGVLWDIDVDGHNLSLPELRGTEHGHCGWWVHADDIELVDEDDVEEFCSDDELAAFLSA